MCWLRRLTTVSVVLLVLGTALSFCGRLHWFPELVSHFRVQAALASVPILVLAAALRMPRTGIAAAAMLVLQAIPVLPYVLPLAPSPEIPTDGPLKILVANVHTANDQHEKLRSLVRQEDPDVVALLEVDYAWLRALGALNGLYKYGAREPKTHNFGIALWSRVPLEAVETRELVHEDIPAILANLEIGERSVTLLLAHPVPPGGARSALRNEQLAQLAQIRGEFNDRDFILIGDLNTTPWSPFYADLERRAGLVNAARGRGYFPTWPTTMPPLMIPLDHCLLSPGLVASSYSTGPDIGSDHLPVIVEIVPTNSGT